MIMIIAIIYIFLSYAIFDQQLKIISENPQLPPPPGKIHPPLLNHSPTKNSKSASLPLFANIENFSGPPAERGGGHCVVFFNLLILVETKRHTYLNKPGSYS